MKPGYRTTEFWLQFLVAVVNALIVSDVLIPGSQPIKIVSVVALVLQALGYNMSRTQAKARAAAGETTPPAPPPAQGGFARLDTMLVILAITGLALGSMATGCGASQRDTTIRTTYSALTVAQVAFTAYDLAEQRTLAASASSESEALAKLDEYKAKRAKVLEAFEVAYKMLAAAGALEDDPSLSGALKAWKLLSEALAAFSNGELP